jgi:hypothetical protein
MCAGYLVSSPAGKRARTHLVVIGLFAAVSLAFTWPVWLRPAATIAGEPGDNLLFVWNIWQTQSALEAGENPIYTDRVFYPHRQPLVLHTHALLHATLLFPLRHVLGLVGTYNCWMLASLVLAGWGAFLLVRDVTQDTPSAIVGSFIFTFSPFRMAHLAGHMMLVSAHWLPFYVLFLLRMRAGRWWHAVAAGVFLGLILWTDLHYFLYSVILTAATLIGWFWARQRVPLQAVVWQVALLAATFALPAIPFAIAAQEAGLALTGADSSLVADRFTTRALSARLADFVRPAKLHPVWGRWMRTNVEHELYVGFVVLGLAGWACWPRHAGNSQRLYWLGLSLLLAVLAMGPAYAVRIAGRPFTVPLPHLLLDYVPGANLSRVPARFMGLGMLPIGVLAAIGLRRLLDAGRRWLAVLFVCCLVFEHAAGPYPVTEVRAPASLSQLARTGGSVIDVPFHAGSALDWSGRIERQSLTCQTIHGLPRVGGWLSRCRDTYRQELLREPVLGTLLRLAQFEAVTDEQRQRDRGALGDTAAKYSIRHALIQPSEVGQESHRYLRQLFPDAREHPLEDGGIWMEFPTSPPRKLAKSASET